VKNNKLYTPALTGSGIYGVYLKSLQQTHDVDFISVKPQELAQFDAVFCCNSLMGLIPVTRIGAEYFALQRAQELMVTLSIS
jgi:4-amino-4-deoxychorismate lyase